MGRENYHSCQNHFAQYRHLSATFRMLRPHHGHFRDRRTRPHNGPIALPMERHIIRSAPPNHPGMGHSEPVVISILKTASG